MIMSNDNRIDLSGALNKPAVVAQSALPGAVAETLPSTVSFSSLNMFDSCPYSWYLQYVKKLRAPRYTLAMDTGTAFHKMAELFDGKSTLDELMVNPEFGSIQAEAVLEARRIFERWYSPEKMADILVINGERMHEKYFEYPITVNEHEIKVIGYIDAIKSKGGEVEVVDYKTGSSLYTKDLQLSIYAMPVFRDNAQLEKLRVTFDYVAEGAHGVLKSKTVVRKDAMETESVVKGKVSAILDSFEHKSFAAKPGKSCRLCPFTDACDYYKEYMAALPMSADNVSSVEDLKKLVTELSLKIDIEQKTLTDMQELLETRDPSSVSKYTIYDFKVNVSTILDTLRDLHVPPDRYFHVKSTLGTDIMRGKLPISGQVKDKLMADVETKVYRRIQSGYHE